MILDYSIYAVSYGMISSMPWDSDYSIYAMTNCQLWYDLFNAMDSDCSIYAMTNCHDSIYAMTDP